MPSKMSARDARGGGGGGGDDDGDGDGTRRRLVERLDKYEAPLLTNKHADRGGERAAWRARLAAFCTHSGFRFEREQAFILPAALQRDAP